VVPPAAALVTASARLFTSAAIASTLAVFFLSSSCDRNAFQNKTDFYPHKSQEKLKEGSVVRFEEQIHIHYCITAIV
jgi:hypothetical protein